MVRQKDSAFGFTVFVPYVNSYYTGCFIGLSLTLYGIKYGKYYMDRCTNTWMNIVVSVIAVSWDAEQTAKSSAGAGMTKVGHPPSCRI